METQSIPLEEAKSKKEGSIKGPTTIGKEDPRAMSEAEFSQSPEILYHGAAKKFAYNHKGEYDMMDTGGDGTTDYGAGFYTTDNYSQAENYSKVRGRREDAIVYKFLPHQAKMLDVRDIRDPKINGTLPASFIKEWLTYLEEYLKTEDLFPDLAEWVKKNIREEIKATFIDRLKEQLEKNEPVKIRVDGGGVEGIFWFTKNGLIDIAFRDFMMAKGFDGLIYREGGEGDERQDLTGYVFYNPKAIDTYTGWQKRGSA